MRVCLAARHSREFTFSFAILNAGNHYASIIFGRVYDVFDECGIIKINRNNYVNLQLLQI